MRTVAGAILIAAAAICISIASLATFHNEHVGYMAAFVPGILGLVLLVWGLLTEGRGSGDNS